MNLDDLNNSVKKTDTFLDSLKALLKKHWGIILLLLFGGFFYWILTSDEPAYSQDPGQTEYMDESTTDASQTDETSATTDPVIETNSETIPDSTSFTETDNHTE